MKKIIVVVFVVPLLFFILVFIFNNPFLSITLNGENNYEIDVNSKYEDKLYRAKLFNYDMNSKVIIDSNLDTSKIGNYKITYTLKLLKTIKQVSRNIKVVDRQAPIITLKGNNEIVITEKENYEEPGFLALDNYDGDISENVVIDFNLDINTKGEYTIIYKVVDSSNNEASITRKVIVKEKSIKQAVNIQNESGLTYINGILVVNKTYSLPSDYAPLIDPTALYYLHMLQIDAKSIGIDIPVISAFRSYETQKVLFDSYYAKDKDKADTYSARPGHSEHQTGLAFDVGAIDDNYGDTIGGKWLYNNCANYGFIIRYLKGKESITGYKYEPWHIRYVGYEVAMDIMNRGITLEEYLNIA